MFSFRWMSSLTAVALLLAACSGTSSDDDSSPTTGAVSSSTTDQPAPLPALPPVDPIQVVGADGEETEVTLMRSDLGAAVDDGVEAGLFTEVEGLVAAIGGFTGQNPPVEGLGVEDVTEPGLTGLARRAGDLLDSGTLRPDEASRLEAALAFLNPTQAVLDAISAPSPSGSSGGVDSTDEQSRPATAVLVAFQAQVDESEGDQRPECEQGLASMGFDPEFSTGSNCYFFDEEVVDGHTLRMYYPASYLSQDDGNQALLELTMEAMTKSTTVYSQLGVQVGDVNAVFSVTDSSSSLASQMYFDLDEACPLTIFPGSFGGDESGFYQQTIAHEMFHCSQDRTYTTEPYGTHKWWLEGSAEYFSNVVYPGVNDEHQWTGDADTLTSRNDPTQLAYENTVFFQFYANREGNAALLQLLHDVSSNGATLSSLGEIEGMRDVLQDFTIAFLADKIFDPGGGTVGQATTWTKRERVSDVRQITVDAKPMHAARYLVRYDKEKRYVSDWAQDDPLHATVERESVTNLDEWEQWPTDIRSKCGEDLFLVVVATSPVGDLTFLDDVLEVEEAECDPCLLGAWKLRNASFEEYMTKVFESVGGLPATVQLEISGDYFFEFDDEGGLKAERRALEVGVGPIGFIVPNTSISGIDMGNYTTKDGMTLKISGLSGGGAASIGSMDVGFLTDPTGGEAPYTCDEDVLVINDPSYGPLEIDRIDEIPDPADVDPETGTPEQ